MSWRSSSGWSRWRELLIEEASPNGVYDCETTPPWVIECNWILDASSSRADLQILRVDASNWMRLWQSNGSATLQLAQYVGGVYTGNVWNSSTSLVPSVASKVRVKVFKDGLVKVFQNEVEQTPVGGVAMHSGFNDGRKVFVSTQGSTDITSLTVRKL